jgi:hypothetical protein
MPIQKQHDLHKRRAGRNIGLGLCLAAFVVIVFGLSIAKVRQGASLEAFDHQPRISITPAIDEAAE